VLWTDDGAYIWEIKPNTPDQLELGREQLARYIRQLQAELDNERDGRLVRRGYPHARQAEIPTPLGPVDAWSQQNYPGLRIYASTTKWKREPIVITKQQDDPSIGERIMGGVHVVGGLATIAGTIVEDVATVGVGIVDDPVTIALGASSVTRGLELLGVG
jgi:hypothetical protein